ncbi:MULTISPECIES: hypothetical protein [Mesorhizobium]|uniref:hypothetical protein n=1 Tax=Mesorhizobium TaxID=68287 RepID=UPI0007EC8ECE|nr:MULTISPECIES: hypothetical protein [Mesorhizobium]TPJ43841.1 hypothetical protein FJ437_19345 [Mesorhizobium sp. B2-6-6]ARP67095.1 hypothetical protein A9K65_029900 [Mesorhizobium sp. WSM1497]MCA0002168.1 hypothetical protein [Mesorhizobium sp. B264B2A]MCA0008869.1 hypothetical protein [Mesorhizobium sp. B264B1B]MCA0015410.1 hypothetical protein [Mesorhizobium sp. B294B1A1]
MRLLLCSLIAFAAAGSCALAQDAKLMRPKSFADFVRQTAPDLIRHLDAAALERTNSQALINEGELLKAPRYPFARPMSQLPEGDSRTLEYVNQLSIFLEQHQKLGQITDQFRLAVGSSSRPLNAAPDFLGRGDYFSSKVNRWNGNIFWAPASKETDINLRYADEVRAVFGPIPPFDVTTLGRFVRSDGSVIETRATYVEVDGNRAELKPNSSKSGSPLEYEHRDKNGVFVNWTATIDKCDKPSLAGGVTPCGTASRLSRIEKGNVEWIALARKTHGPEILRPEKYWSENDNSYALLGYIGFNQVSGELAFFDGSYEGIKFDWSTPTVAPGGGGYNDTAGRTLASKTYDATFRVDCAACHDNKEPRIITPYIKQARVGYRDKDEAAAFSLGDLLPERTRNSKTPYRVVGTDYTAAHRGTLDGDLTIVDPARNCTSCHGLTNNGTGRFASDAVGRLGSIAGDSGLENSFRTDWALRTGAGKIHPWMYAEPQGNDVSDPQPAPISDADWDKLRAVIENADGDSRSLKTYTDAPTPESTMDEATRIGDPSGPQNFAVGIEDNPDGSSELSPKRIRLDWTYINSFGGVPERDDVRFNVAIHEVGIPSDGAEPASGDFPSIEQTKALGFSDLGGGVFTDGTIFVLRDMSFQGHMRWINPAPTLTPRQYRLYFPASLNKRYLIRVAAKRFGFDQGGERVSAADHLLKVDIK